MERIVKAWWFSSGHVLPRSDGRPIAIGITHKAEGEIVPCQHGLHGSIRLIDALRYAPGPIVWRTAHSGTIVQEDDKLVSSERAYIGGGIDAGETLRKFARREAWGVRHLWNMPKVVARYLCTGDESLRDDASDAAWAATEAATKAGHGAAGAAAWSTTWDATAAAKAAAWAAAEAAAWAGAVTGWGAADAAAWDTAETAAGAAKAQQNRRLTRMVWRAIGE